MSIHLNEKAYKQAMELIKENRFIVDDNHSSKWKKLNPDNNAMNDYLKNHTIHEYGLWFLGINNRIDNNETIHYQLPYGDFTNLHKGALFQALKEAHNYHYHDIQKAIEHLIELVEKKEAKLH